VGHCAYLYEWLDISDYWGEANAFFWQIKAAIDNYRHNPEHHTWLMRTALNIDASWDASAAKYIEMYRYSFIHKQWQAARQQLVDKFTGDLNSNHSLFSEFFIPAKDEYADPFDWALRNALDR